MIMHTYRTPAAHYRSPEHQREVDAAQARIRADIEAGRRSLFKPPPPGPGRSEAVLDERIAEELDVVIRQLEQLGDILSGDPILLHRHAASLQSIDLMQQVLGHLGRVVAARDKTLAVDRVTLTALKGRLQRKAIRAVSG